MIRRLLTRLLYAVLSAFVLASAVLYALAGTAPGTQLLLEAAIGLGNLPVKVARTQGSLLGGLELDGITWKGAAATVRIGRARLRWRALDLLAGRLHLDRLTATHVQVTLPAHRPAVKTASPPARFAVPLTVVLAHFEVRGLSITRGTQTWRVGSILASASLHGPRFELGRLRVNLAQGNLTASGDALLTPPYRNHLHLAWHWRMADGTSLAGHGTLGGDLQRLAVSQDLSAPFPVVLTGHVAPLKMSADVALSWHAAHWPLQGSARLHSPQGKLTFSGTANAYTAAVRAAVQGTGFPQGTFALSGTGNRRRFDIRRLRVDTLGGTVSGSGAVTWAPALGWHADLTGQDLNPAGYLPRWPGSLGFTLHADGTRSRASVDLVRLAGTLRHIAFQASAKASAHGTMINITHAHLQAAGGQVNLSGHASRRQGQLSLDFSLPQLNTLIPQAKGSVRGHARIDGPWRWPQVDATAQAKELSWKNVQVRRASLHIISGSGKQLNAHLEAEDLRRGKIALQQVRAQLSGTPNAQQLSVALKAAQGQLALTASGAFGKDYRQWAGQLVQLRIDPVNSSAWQLTAPAALQIGRKAQTVGSTCLRPVAGGSSTLCTHFSLASGALKAAAHVAALPLQMADPWLPPATQLSGRLDATAQLQGPVDSLTGKLHASLSQGVVQLRSAGTQHRLAFAVPTLDATLKDGAMSARVRAAFPQQNASLDAQAHIGSPQNGSRSLSGAVQLDVPSVSVFEPFTAQLHALTGNAQARLNLAGTLRQPRISGSASLTDASATVLATGIRLQHVDVQANLPPNGDSVSFDASADSGPGKLHATGKVTGLASGQPQLTMAVKGERFQALDLPQVQALASPDLTLNADRAQLKVRGKVTLPEAKIRVHRLPAQAVNVSSDTQVVGQSPPKARGPALDAQIELALGNQVSIDAFGLTGKLSGNLKVRDQGISAPTADGSLNIVNGTYQAYGLDLTLSRGRLNFAGPLDNPGLDVVAQRQTGPVTAQLTVSGTLKSPHSSISATPPMSQADALSWLITGHGINQASRGDAALLLKAIYSMNVADNGGGLVGQIKQRTGLSDIGVSGGSTLQQSALVLGKYLTPKVYLRYTTGLFQRMNTLSLTYQLSRHLSVEAQSGATQALDLLYQLEFGNL